MLTNSSILITGGTGSFGHTFVPMTLAKFKPRRLVIYSRDEMKQWEMAKLYGDDERVRFFIGDVRDKERTRLFWATVNIFCISSFFVIEERRFFFPVFWSMKYSFFSIISAEIGRLIPSF